MRRLYGAVCGALCVVALLALAGCARVEAPGGASPVSPPVSVSPSPGALPSPGLPDAPPPFPPDGMLVEVTAPGVPTELRNWAASIQMEQAPAFHVVREGGYAYVGVAGGLKRSGGFSIAVGRWTVHQEGQKQVLEVGFTVVPPPPGVGVTAALTNPVVFYRAPGDVEVRVTVSGG